MYPNDGKDAEMLIKNADEAMFRVKEKGKAHYQFYRSDMNTVFTNIVTLETNLQKDAKLISPLSINKTVLILKLC